MSVICEGLAGLRVEILRVTGFRRVNQRLYPANQAIAKSIFPTSHVALVQACLYRGIIV